jgi:hypothetical protein
MNEVYTYQSSGRSKEQALNLLNTYSRDAYDRALKKKVIDQLWAPPEIKIKTDPQSYIELWEKVQNGDASKMEIDAAFKRGELSVSAWEGLRKSKYKIDAGDDKENDSQVGKYIIRCANQENLKGKDRYDFITYMQSATEGKSLQEATAIIDDGLKKTGGGFLKSGTQEWKLELQKTDRDNLSWGKLYKKIGKNGENIVNAIGQGVLLSTNKDKFDMSDVDNFIGEIGGYSALREGSPERRAIDMLMNNNQTVNAVNVRYIIQKYHLDNVQKDISSAFDSNLEDPYKLKY